MRISKLEPLADNLELQVDDEDIALADILHHELLQDERVSFAGTVRSHPLVKRFTIKLQTKKAKPKDVLLASCEKALDETAKLLNEIEKKVG